MSAALSIDRRVDALGSLLAIQKEQCERSLCAFIRHAWRLVDPADYVHGRHTEIIAMHLEAMVRGHPSIEGIYKLLVNLPPGHQKSLTVCVFFPAWVWGPANMPSKRFLFTSYREDLALRDADKTRELIRSPWYQELWGDRVELRGDQNQKKRYATSRGGYRISTSVSGIMGEGGDYVIFDDPHNVEQAESGDVRDEAIRRINLALPTRVRSAKGGVVCIMQRLHERDYAGHILRNEKDDWDHLCLPARYEHPKSESHPKGHPHPIRSRIGAQDWRTEEGELLFPELFDEQRMAQLERPLGIYGAAGQLQQRPTPREGSLIKRAWLEGNVVDTVPTAILKAVRAWDLAASEDPTADRSAHVKMVAGADQVTYIVDARAFRANGGEVRTRLKRIAKTDGDRCKVRIPQDPGQAGKDQAESFVRELVGYPVSVVRPTGSKEVRAGPFIAQLSVGAIKILRGPWNDDYFDELCSFPAPGAHDDLVDATSDAFSELVLGPNYASGQSYMRG